MISFILINMIFIVYTTNNSFNWYFMEICLMLGYTVRFYVYFKVTKVEVDGHIGFLSTAYGPILSHDYFHVPTQATGSLFEKDTYHQQVIFGPEIGVVDSLPFFELSKSNHKSLFFFFCQMQVPT